MTIVQLGDKVKDPVTGIEGIAMGKTQWLHGCYRINVQPKGKNKDGLPFEMSVFDEPQLIVLTNKKIKVGSKKTGGPLARGIIKKY